MILRPDLLPLLLAAPLAWAAARALERRRARRVARLVGPRVRAVAAEALLERRGLRDALFGGGVLLAAVAALHPAWGDGGAEVERRGADVVLCLDVSRSMLARDVAPDRLGAAKRELVALARAARGDRLALVAFAGDARLVVPLTEDVRSFEAMVALVDPTSVERGGTDLAAALDAADRALAGRSGDHAAVVLLTDGEDLAGRGREAAARLGARGIEVDCVGFGTRLGGKIALPADPRGGRPERFLADAQGTEVVSRGDPESLTALAAAAGGVFADGSEPGALVEVHRTRVVPRAARAVDAARRRERPSRHQVPLLAALLLWTVERAIPRRRAPRAGRGARSPALRAAAAASVVLAALTAGCDATEPGREAWAAGRPEEARAAFARAVADAGKDASPELLYDLAVASLRVGDLPAAREAAERAAARGGPAFAARAGFVRGHDAWARSVLAEEASRGPSGDPRALEAALALTEDALAAWRSAATSRDDWPQARRNVERAMARLQRLREASRRREGAGGREGPPGEGDPAAPPAPEIPPPPPLPPPDAPPGEGAATPVADGDLAPSAVMGVLETLAEKERQRDAARRERRHAPAAGGEDDR